MIFVYSSDTTLVALCSRLFDKTETVRRISGNSRTATPDIVQKDILIVDFESCPEKNLPPVACPTMVLASIPDQAQAMRLLRLGVRAYGNRHMHEDNLVQAVMALKSGQIWLPPAIINQMITSLPNQKNAEEKNPVLSSLTSREAEVAEWLAKGLSNSEIGDKMFISIRTVKAHLTSIFKKTGCRDRLELAMRIK